MKTSALAILLTILSCGPAVGWSSADSEALLSRMETAYGQVQDYQTRLVITGFGRDRAFRSPQELIYRFKKPDRIRIDFIAPHAGMTLLYPTSGGEVLLRPSGWASSLTLRLHSRSSLLEISPGQHIDQTDYGVLIANIRHSLTDMFLGELDAKTTNGQTVLRVLSDNPFRRGSPTRYIFGIDDRLSLPVHVTEMEPDGRLRRTVDYRDLRINGGLSQTIFSYPDPRLD